MALGVKAFKVSKMQLCVEMTWNKLVLFHSRKPGQNI